MISRMHLGGYDLCSVARSSHHSHQLRYCKIEERTPSSMYRRPLWVTAHQTEGAKERMILGIHERMGTSSTEMDE